VCLSKGLGCPVGSVLVGDNEFMDKAIRFRKIFGGGMRQAGFLAAAGIYALDYHYDRLAEDNLKAKQLGKLLSQQDFIKKVEPVETNIVIFELNAKYSQQEFNSKMKDNHIRLSDMGQGKQRVVTHHDFTDDMFSKFCEVIASL
jgi:threonine aldolase